jgi:lipopolysaccharide transport system permease protein
MSSQVSCTTNGVPSDAPVPRPAREDVLVDPAPHETPRDLPVLILRPPQGWQFINVGELWRFRDLVFFLTWRDVKVRYKQTLLGAAWAVLQPALMMVVFTIFFGRMVGVSTAPFAKEIYPVFAFAGLLPWTFFATAIATAGNSVVVSERLITKVYFPRLAVPLAAVGAAVVDFAIACGLLAVLMAYYKFYYPDQIALGPNLLLIPVVFAVLLMAAVGVGSLLAALNVSYRDFRYVIPFLVQVWMFATPTVYMQPQAGGGGLHAWLALNPLTALIETFRAAALGGPVPWASFGISAAGALGMLLVGCVYFRKVEDHLADII